MSGQIVFLSLFLGLVSGKGLIDLHVDDAIKSVRVVVDGREVTTLTQPPWHAELDFGKEIVPRELMAIGYDAGGNEVARTSQVLNLPRPTAEFEIVLERNHTAASLRWRHLTNARPKSAILTLDGTLLHVDEGFRAHLPRLDFNVPHVIAAQLRFSDGFVARRELVIAGGVSDSIGTQLTPIAVRVTTPKLPATFEGCFNVNGAAVRTAAVEKPGALVIIIHDPDTHATRSVARLWALDPSVRTLSFGFGADTAEEIIFPIAKRFVDVSQTAVLFEHSPEIGGGGRGVISMLTTDYGESVSPSQPRQFADAVAVAGVKAVTGGRRRAVVLLLSGDTPDASRHHGLSVRRYLASIGVPLFVWSLTEPRPEQAAAWGEIDEISSAYGLRRATERVRSALDSQRIAWLASDPVSALRVSVRGDCGVAPLARLAQ